MAFCFFTKQHHIIKFKVLVYSAIIAGKNKIKDDIYLRLFESIKEVHQKKTNAIIKQTKEQVNKATKDPCGIDMILKEISYSLKTNPELVDSINFATLKCLLDEEDVVSLRVLDFLVDEVKECERRKF